MICFRKIRHTQNNSKRGVNREMEGFTTLSSTVQDYWYYRWCYWIERFDRCPNNKCQESWPHRNFRHSYWNCNSAQSCRRIRCWPATPGRPSSSWHLLFSSTFSSISRESSNSIYIVSVWLLARWRRRRCCWCPLLRRSLAGLDLMGISGVSRRCAAPIPRPEGGGRPRLKWDH